MSRATNIKGSFKADIGPYEAYVGLFWQHFGFLLRSNISHYKLEPGNTILPTLANRQSEFPDVVVVWPARQ